MIKLSMSAMTLLSFTKVLILHTDIFIMTVVTTETPRTWQDVTEHSKQTPVVFVMLPLT